MRALYFPRFEPTKNWIYAHILSFDGLASIVTEHGYQPRSNLINELVQLGEFTFECVEDYYHEPSSVLTQQFGDPNLELLKDLENFQSELRLINKRKLTREVLINQMINDETRNYGSVEYLRLGSSVAPLGVGALAPQLVELGFALDAGDKIFVKKKFYEEYMSALAFDIADRSTQTLIPCTDRSELPGFIDGGHQTEALPLSCINLVNILPKAGPGAALKDLVRFKQNHRSELLAFRLELSELFRGIEKSTSLAEQRYLLATFAERIEKSRLDLDKALLSNRIDTVFSSIEAVVDIRSPTVAVPLTALAGAGFGMVSMPMAMAVSGVIVAGAIQIGRTLWNSRKSFNEIKARHPFSYISSAERRW